MSSFNQKNNNMCATAIPVPQVSEHELMLRALARPEYMWRTVAGIARETGLSADVVEKNLSEMGECVVRSAVPDDHGRTRYTTLEHYRAHAGILRRVLDALSDQVR